MTDSHSDAMPAMKLELVPIPVADVDSAKAFYSEKIGFHLDFDVTTDNGMRVCQLTPPGSGCSILIGTGLGEISEMKPGSIKGIHLVVASVAQVRDILASRGVEVSAIHEYDRGIKSAFFKDPDGNSWELQEIPPGI